MSDGPVYFPVGGLTPAPASGKKVMLVDTDGAAKLMDSTGAKASIGGGFGSDTIVDLPNASSTLVQALELITTLTNNVAGSEQSKFLAKLLSTANGGAAIGAWSIEPNQMTIDAGLNTAYTFSLKYNGAQVASIGFNNNGQILITGGGANGAIIITDPAGTVQQNIYTGFGTRFGSSLQEKQFANTASANQLSITPGGVNAGNVGHITGTTTINLIDTFGWQNGCYVHLIFDGVLTLTHNAAPSGNFLPMLLAGSTNKTTAVNDRYTFRLLGANSGTASVAWYQWGPVTSA